MIETPFGIINDELDDKVEGLRGRTIVKAEHVTGDSDADEEVRLTLDDGTVATFGTSEWLHIEIEQPEQAGQAKPTTAGA
jgi:hypothetical protein